MLEYIKRSSFEEDNLLFITIGENKYNTKFLDRIKKETDSSNNIFVTKVYDTKMDDLNNLLNTYFK